MARKQAFFTPLPSEMGGEQLRGLRRSHNINRTPNTYDVFTPLR